MARDDYYERESAYLATARLGAQASLAVANAGLQALGDQGRVEADNLRVELENRRARALAELDALREDQRKLELAERDRAAAAAARADERDRSPGPAQAPPQQAVEKMELADASERHKAALEAAERSKQDDVLAAERDKLERLRGERDGL